MQNVYFMLSRQSCYKLEKNSGLTGAENTPAFRITGHPWVIAGSLYGLRQSSLAVPLLIEEDIALERVMRAGHGLSALLPDDSIARHPLKLASIHADSEAAADTLLYWMMRLQQAAGVPMLEQGKIIARHAATRTLVVAVPAVLRMHTVTGQVLSWLIEMFNSAGSDRALSAALRGLPDRIKLLAKTVPGRSNTPRFLKAAFAMGLPCREVAGEVYQFGYGSRARLLDSTFTDKTPQIAAHFARNKLLASDVLRGAGIPVPAHRLVPDVAMALKVADDLGFPVVVKPSDLDGGVAVFAGLTSPDEVRRAFSAAQRKSKNILVEKHVEGRDYRLTVFQGELVWAIERIPGGVTGDGSSTVAALIERLNSDPRRGEGPHAPLKRIIPDEESSLLLSRAGMGMESVPGTGVFVRLRRAANVACGGMPCSVFEQVHPDNALLAVRAAAALRLDLAGVDLLIPDISRSWLETGAVVCEVNGQPNLGETTAPHLYAELLRKLVQGSGRVPAVVVVGASPEWDIGEAVAGRLDDAGFRTGRADSGGVIIGGHCVTAGTPDSYTAGMILTGDNNVDAVVLCITDTAVLRRGLPFDRYDMLVFAGSHITLTGEEQRIPRERLLRDFFAALSPCCDGRVIVVTGSGLDSPELFGKLPEAVRNEPVEKSRAAETIAAALMHADSRHRSGEALQT